jgi:hypothetical protein
MGWVLTTQGMEHLAAKTPDDLPDQRLLTPLAHAGIACAATGTASADDSVLRFNNLTDTTIIRLYVSPSGAGDWGEDLLASGMRDPGESMLLAYDDGSGNCIFDVKALYTSDESSIQFEVDFCAIDDYNFRP